MVKTINLHLDTDVVSRKEATGKTHEDLYLLGLETAEVAQKENFIDMRAGAETVG